MSQIKQLNQILTNNFQNLEMRGVCLEGYLNETLKIPKETILKEKRDKNLRFSLDVVQGAKFDIELSLDRAKNYDAVMLMDVLKTIEHNKNIVSSLLDDVSLDITEIKAQVALHKNIFLLQYLRDEYAKGKEKMALDGIIKRLTKKLKLKDADVKSYYADRQRKANARPNTAKRR